MLTRVVAKQAKTTKVKNKFVSGKKKFKRTLSCLFGGRGKVQSRRKKFGDKVQAKSSNLPRRFCSNSVGTPLEFAAFRSDFDVKYSRASAFWFFLSTTMVFTAFRTHFARKNTSIFMLIGSLSRKKEISIKINYAETVKRPWPSGLVAGFDTQREQEFFFLCFFFFNKTTWMRVFSQINNCQQKQNKKTKPETKAKNRQNKKGGSAFRLG